MVKWPVMGMRAVALAAALGSGEPGGSAAGAAVLDVAAEAVTAFLEQAAAVVPLGTEGAHLDLDRVVAELLGRGA
ncbi:hypothetical protein [Actinacidiphila yeochonensis]|uniref:hypothetical protein n=1 Tax=Actinacidiphila yeochonensis TaxID=89050 RepID=UPI0005672C9C|nr:hypothetical protein [Actinacidiphila yeochonensis]